MKKRFPLIPFLLFLMLSTFSISCSGDDDETTNGNNNTNDNEIVAIECGTEGMISNTTVCNTQVGDYELAYALPQGTPKRLAVYFHGDGSERPNLSGLFAQTEFAQANDVILLAIHANTYKDTDRGPIRSWAKKNGAEGVTDVIDAFVNLYDLPTNNMFFIGVSGGAWYLTDDFIPATGHLYQGSYHIACGANNPEDRDFVWDPTTQTDFTSKIFINYDYGSGDFLVPSIERSIEYYRNKGFSVFTPDPLGGEGHCGTPFNTNAVDFWTQYL